MDWFRFFDLAPFDTVAAGAESNHLPGNDWQNTVNVTNETAYNGMYVFFREAFGPGWVLLGDSVHHKDSITARGITDAFIQAQSLTDHIGERLHDDAALMTALSHYERDLDDKFYNLYQAALNVAELKPERQSQMLRKLVGHQELVDRYFSTVSGACSFDDFYNTELLTVLDQS